MEALGSNNVDSWAKLLDSQSPGASTNVSRPNASSLSEASWSSEREDREVRRLQEQMATMLDRQNKITKANAVLPTRGDVALETSDQNHKTKSKSGNNASAGSKIWEFR